MVMAEWYGHWARNNMSGTLVGGKYDFVSSY